MTKRNFATHIHEDQYKCIGVSTIHLTESDTDKLSLTAELAGSGKERTGMILERDTGFFIKLYEETECTLTLIDNLSQEAQDVIMACHEAGFRMIEFDRDADELLEYT